MLTEGKRATPTWLLSVEQHWSRQIMMKIDK